MKYKVINSNYEIIKSDDLLEIILKQRGVENPKELLSLNESCIHNSSNFKNMTEAIETFNKHITNKSKILIQVDSDVDGYTSSALIYNYIKDIDKDIDISYHIHSGKQHGMTSKEYLTYDYDLLIVPDAGSEDFEEAEAIRDRGKDIIVLDHHKFTEDNCHAIVVNCQDGVYENSTLSGVGVVYKFCKEYDSKFGYQYADKYLDLVALGMVADEMDMRNYETRYLSLKGISHFGVNEFLKEIAEKQKEKLKDGVNIMGIGWYIAPLLNAVVRIGTQEEKYDVFKAMIGVEDYREYKPRKSKKNPNPEVEIQSLQKFMARHCVNIKGRQDRLVKKGVELLNSRIEEKGLDENKVIIVDGTDDLEPTFTGLVANKLSEKYRRPTILLRKRYEDEKKILYGGSCRNYRLSPIPSFMEFLREIGTFYMLKGHDNAFGFGINAENLIETRDIINKKLEDVKIEDIYSVDYEIPVGRLKEKQIVQVGEWKDIWGNSIQEPMFAITDIYISSEDVKLIGSKNNIIKFDKKIGGSTISFIKFFANEDMYNSLILKSKKGLNSKSSKRLKIDVVGKFKINEWNESKYPQIEVVDFNVTENNEVMF